MKIQQSAFGKQATLYSLENDNGVKVQVTDFGARIVNFLVPVDTLLRNIVLGFDDAEEYLDKDSYIGATIGRVAGRITKGSFTIDQQTYQLPVQASGHVLHGGDHSFDEQYWQAKTTVNENTAQVVFRYTSRDGENGFPGNLLVEVTHSLNNKNEWAVSYKATTDKATLFNPTNHVYFNLLGNTSRTIDQHQMRMSSDRFVVIDHEVLPTGEVRKVDGTPFDFREFQPFEQVFTSDDEQTKLFNGLDHPFLFEEGSDNMVEVRSADQKLLLKMTTTEPSVVIFTANFSGEGPVGRGRKIIDHSGFTLETQVQPGAVEYPGFGNIVLKPGMFYESKTTYTIERP